MFFGLFRVPCNKLQLNHSFKDIVGLRGFQSCYSFFLYLSDAFRGPLASAFKLHVDVASFQDLKTGIDTDHVCLRTDGIADKYRHWATKTNILTDYGCLLLSPANLWQREFSVFQYDANVVSTGMFSTLILQFPCLSFFPETSSNSRKETKTTTKRFW